MFVLRFVALATLALAVCAAPEVGGSSGNLKVGVGKGKDISFSRDIPKVESVFRLVERIHAAEAAIDAIPTKLVLEEYDATLSALQEKMKALIRTNENSAAARIDVAFQHSIDAAKIAVASNGDSLYNTINNRLKISDDKLTGLEGAVVGDAEDKIQQTSDDVDKSLAAMQGKLNQQVAQITQTLDQNTQASNQKLATLGQSVNKDLSGAVKDMNDKLKALEGKVSTAAKAAADAFKNNAYPKRLIWAGGCRSHGRRDGWKPYCHDATDFNTLQAHVQLTGDHENSGFRVKKAGYYRINHYYIGQRHWNHMGVWHNNRHVHHGHEYTDGNWHDQFADLTWKMNVGDLFWVQIYGSGHGYWNYHSWNAGGAHSRLEIEYLGVLPP